MEGLTIGFLVIRWNSILILTGIAAGAALTAFEFKRRDLELEILFDLFLPLLIWSTIGARLWHLIFPPLSSVELGLTSRFYFSNILDSFAVWRGGFGIPGALIGGMITVWVFARTHELNTPQLLDTFAPGILLAQSIGRLGNYFNQELYGLPTQLPWKIFIEADYRLNGYEVVEFYHPLFAYESILTFAGMFLLIWMSRKLDKRSFDGALFLAYLASYSLIRFTLEYLRLDAALVGEINVNQLFFFCVFALVGLLFFIRQRAVRGL